MFNLIASVAVSAGLVLGGMWAHIAFDKLTNRVDSLKTNMSILSSQVKDKELRFGLSTYVPAQGGTGTSTNPVAGDILMSFASNAYGPTALYAGSGITLSTSTYRRLTITGTGSAFEVATTSNIAVPELAYFTQTSGRTTLGSVATGTISATNGVTVTAGRSAVGGALAIDCTVASGSAAGCLSSADWTIFNNSADFAYPFTPITAFGSTFAAGTTSQMYINNSTFPSFFAVNASSTALSATSLSIGGSGTTTISSAGAVSIPSGLTVADLTSALTLTGAGGLFAEYTGTTCTNQFVRVLSALGAATCATVVAGDVDLADLTATNTTLTFSGAYDGSTARTVGLNLGNANTWTALQTINNASTTNLTVGTFFAPAANDGAPLGISGIAWADLFLASGSVINWNAGDLTLTHAANLLTLTGGGFTMDGAFINSDGTLEIPNAASPTVDAIGEFALDTTLNELLVATSTDAGAPAVIKPFTTISFGLSTSTAGSGTTTLALGPAAGAGYINEIQCYSDTFYRVVLYDASSNRTNDLVASSTVGTVKLLSNRVFTSGEAIIADIGTTTAPTGSREIGCRAKFYYTRS